MKYKIKYFFDNLFLALQVGDLQYASPSTVTRAGMVYVDPKNLGYQPYMDKWIQVKSEADQDLLRAMCEKYVHCSLKLIFERTFGHQTIEPLQMIIPQTGLNMVIIYYSLKGVCVTNLDESFLILSGNSALLCTRWFAVIARTEIDRCSSRGRN